jgi:hypothetical protein
VHLIGKNGFLFGTVNSIDLVVVLGLLVAAGVGVGQFVGSEPGGPVTPRQQIVVETEPLPDFVVEAVKTGSVSTESVVTVDEISEVQSVDDMTVLRL